MKNEIKPLPPTEIDGVAGREQLKQPEERIARELMGVDVNFGPSRISIKDVIWCKRKAHEEKLRRMWNTLCQRSLRKQVDSKVIEKPEPKQIEGEKI